MAEKWLANMHFKYSTSKDGKTETIRIFSYEREIAEIICEWDSKRYRKFDTDFYSVTTRRHQGIALAVITSRYSLSRIMNEINKHNSLKGLREFFGYVSRRYWKSAFEHFNITEYF